MRTSGDWEVGIRNADWKISGYTPYNCVYPGLHHWCLCGQQKTELTFSTRSLIVYYLVLEMQSLVVQFGKNPMAVSQKP